MLMNYIRELNAFYDWLESNPCPSDAIALWHALVAICNKAGWPEEFTVANPTLQAKAGLSRTKLDRWRGFLKSKGLIDYKKSERVNEAGKYRIIPFASYVQNETQNDTQNDTQNEIQNGKQNDTQDEAQNEHINKTKRNETKQENIPYAEIVAYLNERTGSSFRPTTKATQTLIRARWREGFRIDDFKRVIDNKTEEWGNDPKMSQYLRPETLFGTKFESYLNAKRKAVDDHAKPRTSPPRGRGEYDFLSL
jgi:uncharacterized phage protein (TIGR02220 family)